VDPQRRLPAQEVAAMKTYLCIEENPDMDDPLFLESGPYTSFIPQIGDLITVNTAPAALRPHCNPDWTERGAYKVISRRYEVYHQEGTDIEMTCELRVEKMP